jgi:hypothetical protein
MSPRTPGRQGKGERAPARDADLRSDYVLKTAVSVSIDYEQGSQVVPDTSKLSSTFDSAGKRSLRHGHCGSLA